MENKKSTGKSIFEIPAEELEKILEEAMKTKKEEKKEDKTDYLGILSNLLIDLLDNHEEEEDPEECEDEYEDDIPEECECDCDECPYMEDGEALFVPTHVLDRIREVRDTYLEEAQKAQIAADVCDRLLEEFSCGDE